MQLEAFLKSTALEVNAQLESFFPRGLTDGWIAANLGKPKFVVDLGASQKSMVEPIWEFLSRGGKRWRPALMILATEAVGGRKKDALPFTVMPELAHNGSIIIDDVEDRSTLRRGKPCTHIIYGTDIAINAGTALYLIPLAKLFANSRVPAAKKAQMYDNYAVELLRLSFGQALDIHWHHGNGVPTEDQYLQMCYYKTGTLARLAVSLGAILGGASKSQLDALGEFAGSIGVAFQIQDDILNILPQNDLWGKELGDDINEGKRTLLVIHALKTLSPEKASRLMEILDAKQNSKSEVSEAISLLLECGSVEYARKVAKDLVMKSWKKLDPKLKDSRAKAMLKEFADYLIERKI
ncbi:MAG: polyprenyl synthetase family protein [Candidatus Diapherotrites archaeon]|uniref:Polyprenyl synthetase family protein n=1 Tax=Candidatus Iainarchaeum sp. TaxID=3101447 RepID=A0A8T3YN02_9ARCH|nr:polyprenyl synthetase family protein [Candidatus Diapherotrites archaeon]